MPTCAVNKCRITSAEVNKRDGVVSFHSFPKEKEMKAKWLKFCGLAKDPGKTLYVCSQHFSRDMFVNDANIQNSVMSDSRPRHRLKRNACPSIRNFTAPGSEPSDRAARYQRKERKIVVEALLAAYEPSSEPRLLPEEQPQNSCLQMEKCESPECPSSTPSESSPSLPLNYCVGKNLLWNENSLAQIPDHINSKGVGLNDLDSTSNMDVLLAAIEISKNRGSTHTTEIGGFNDSGWAEFEEDSKHESSRIDDSSVSVSSKQQPLIARLKDQVNRLKSEVLSKTEKIKHLRLRVLNNNKQFVAVLKMVKEKNKQLKEKDAHLVDKSKTIDDLRKACEQLNEIREKNIMDRVEEVLSGVLTRNQIDLVLKKKKKVKWTAEEIAKSFSLRYHSKPAYELLRTEFNYPLPSLRSLRNWASHINMRKGVLEDVLTLLKIAGTHMTDRERIAVLVYDEMSVQSTTEYDKKNDEVIGPHSEMQLVMARGLFAQWKQPIFVIVKVFRKVNLSSENSDKNCENGVESNDEDELPWDYEPKIRNLEEADGFEYAMGYIAKSQIHERPEWGNHTYQLEQDCEPEMNKENYVQDLSHDGLIQPSDEWLEIGDKLDSCFNWIHNTGPEGDQIGFRNKRDVSKRTLRKLKKKFPHLSDQVLKNFARTRISIRVRHLKKQSQEKKLQKIKNRMSKKRGKQSAKPDTSNVDERSAIVSKNSKKLKHFLI